MKSKITYIGLFICMALMSSCSDYLEVENRNSVTDNVLWSEESNADLFLNDMYNDLLPDANKVTQHLDQFSDNSDVGTNWMAGYANIGNAQITPENYPTGFSEVWDWEKAYKKIRKCNVFIKKVTESTLSDSYKQHRISEARFLRAFVYHWLWMTYGGVPLITVPLDNQNADIPLENPRATAQETFDFIVSELGEVAPLLNETETGNNAGRATKGAALTLKGWCELYHASAQRNPANDIERWKVAAKTCKLVMEMGVYSLAPDFDELFMTNNNSESIFARQYGPDKGNNKEMHFGPPTIGSSKPGWGNFQPTQQLVDEFSMENGLPITDPASGYDPNNPYEGREKRFYATILYNGSKWRNEFEITTQLGGNNSIDLGYSNDNTHTGYYARKRLNENKDLSMFGNDTSYENYMFFRYGEVLLNFAEAENEVNGPTKEVLDAVNSVRTRNGNMPKVEDVFKSLNKESMREIIRRERRVELCFEDKRWWDIRRWEIADKLPDGSPGVMSVPLKGMLIKEDNGTLTYTIVDVRERKFLPKMYLMPLPQGAIDRNSVIAAQNGGEDNWVNGQNPGY